MIAAVSTAYTLVTSIMYNSSINPRPAGVFARTRPARGEGADSAPCLTPERMVVERREERQTKALNKTNPKSTKNFT